MNQLIDTDMISIFKNFKKKKDQIHLNTWDKKLNTLLDDEDSIFCNKGSDTFDIVNKENTYTICISNYPYASSTLYKIDDDYVDRDFRFVPSKSTRIRVHKLSKNVNKTSKDDAIKKNKKFQEHKQKLLELSCI